MKSGGQGKKRQAAGGPEKGFIGWNGKVHVCGSQESAGEEKDKWDWNLAQRYSSVTLRTLETHSFSCFCT